MKNTIGVLAALLLATTVAFGQQYQPLPFPQAVNPALVNGTDEETSPSVTGLAPSMAAKMTVVNRRSPVENGSPFPSAANPALANGASEETSSSVVAPTSHQFDNGSPFPSAANPSKNW